MGVCGDTVCCLHHRIQIHIPVDLFSVLVQHVESGIHEVQRGTVFLSWYLSRPRLNGLEPILIGDDDNAINLQKIAH